MKRWLLALFVVVLVVIGTAPAFAGHHHRRGCCGCSGYSECGGGCGSSCGSCGGGCNSCGGGGCATGGCSSGCTSAVGGMSNPVYAAAPAPALVPPPEIPVDPATTRVASVLAR